MNIDDSDKTYDQGIVKNICIGTFNASATCICPAVVRVQVSICCFM